MRFIVGRFTSFSTEIESFPKIFLYSMKIKVQTRKLAAGCSKHGFEVVDETDEVSSKHGFEIVDETDEVSNHTYGKATLTWFEEIFEEYKN
ncbi:N-ethylammeline chlorohydrolase [Streptococcus pneumoniae]|nr:N-ethylammeline chlorohydrolase [Streptococcus pneumoniae]